MLTVGIDVASSRREAAIAKEEKVFFAAGVHPNSASDWDSDSGEAIEALLGHPRAVAVGETGLDFYRDTCPPDLQRVAFRDQIELARASGLALIIHTRESTNAALDELHAAGYTGPMVFHCWSGSESELGRAIEMGAYISFAGNISFKSADDLRRGAPLVPPDRLLVETDSPFLAPVPHRGRSNRPAYVGDVGRALGEAVGMEAMELAATTSANARALFAW
jgi:TatD DNase family protein